MAPLQGAGVSQPIPPEEGTSSSQAPPDAHQPDDPGPSRFLESLNVSEFQSFDFDFSSLMDLSQPEGGYAAMTDAFNTADQTIPMADLVSFDFNNIQLPAPVDPPLLQLAEEDWLMQLLFRLQTGLSLENRFTIELS
ncbi:Fc.00g023880.m01.CDS01 [Cosmosporella sp. VM-42]